MPTEKYNIILYIYFIKIKEKRDEGLHHNFHTQNKKSPQRRNTLHRRYRTQDLFLMNFIDIHTISKFVIGVF